MSVSTTPDGPGDSADQPLAVAVARARRTADADLTVEDILQVIDADRDRGLPPTQG